MGYFIFERLLYTLEMKLLIFDYDKTLAKPIESLTPAIASELVRLLEKNFIAIISGGRDLNQLDRLLTKYLPIREKELLFHLYLCPWYGNQIYRWNNGYRLIFDAPHMSDIERREIFSVLDNFQWENFGIKRIYGDQIEDRGTFVSINCLGKDVPKEIKEKWDPDKAKRLVIKRALDNAFNNKFDIYATGRNTIDIVSKDNTKADNTIVLAKLIGVPLSDIVYTGDEFTPHGNDFPMLELDQIKINMVNGPEETLEILKRM
jgi:HAD superfamily hydrolase (TIGR01484 family)